MNALKNQVNAVVLFGLVVGCTKSNDPPTCTMTSDGQQVYQYDNNHRWVGGTGTFGVNYTVLYDLQDRVGEISMGDFGYDVIYGVNGKVSEIAFFNFSKTTERYVFHYNEAQQISAYRDYRYNTTTVIDSFVYNYQYPNAQTKNFESSTFAWYRTGYILQVDGTYTLYPNVVYGTEIYEYDNKKNPYNSLHGFNPEFGFFPHLVTDNNIIKISSLVPPATTPSVRTNTYTYNDKGYPLAGIVITYPWYNPVNPSYNFTYSNCK